MKLGRTDNSTILIDKPRFFALYCLRMYVLKTIYFLTLLLCALHVSASKLTALKIQQEDQNVTILFTVQGESKYKAFTLPQPDRTVVDLYKTTSLLNFKILNQHNNKIFRIRSSYNPEYLRIVFDMKAPTKITTISSKKIANAITIKVELTPKMATSYSIPQRIETKPIPLKKSRLPTTRKPTEATHKSMENKKPLTHRHQQPIHIKRMPSKPLRDVVIVLDPGHGGKDPGAKGPRRHVEKNLVLAIAVKLKQLIDKEPGMRAVLTRHGDYYIGLRKRLSIARKDNADVFVSIHSDAFINQHARGASVYALSQRGATSEAARWLAEKENYSELGGVNLSGLDDQSGLIRTVLLDLSQTATISSSLQMGSRVLKSLNKITSLHYSSVEQARFMVLKSPDIPSILIETGFISNPREEINLTNASYQDRLSQAIFEGLKRYFWDYPPHGTRLEAMAGTKLHIVRAGETLNTIANKYQVTSQAIINKNHLTTNKLKKGQRLSVPLSWS